jgi:ribosomal-protein-alanine N-acetyltransferase
LPLREQDTYKLHEILINETVRRYLFRNKLILLSQTKKIIATSQRNFQTKQYGLWFLADSYTGKTVGLAGLWDFFAEPQPQLLCVLLPGFWKKGFAKEASAQLIRYAFEELDFQYLMASCDVANREAIAVMKKLSMQKIREEVIDYRLLVFYQLSKFSDSTYG